MTGATITHGCGGDVCTWKSVLHAKLVDSDGIEVESVNPLGPEEQEISQSGYSYSFDTIVSQALSKIDCDCATDQLPDTSTAVKCAAEGGACQCNGLVAYMPAELSPATIGHGIGHGMFMATARDNFGSMPCTNDEFGFDPAKGEHKQCICIPGCET